MGLAAAGALWGGSGFVLLLAVSLALVMGEAARHAWRNRAVVRLVSRWGVVLALVRRSCAGLLGWSRTLVRQHAILAPLCIPVCVWRPGLLGWLGFVGIAAVLGEWLARRPRLSPAVFVSGYGLDVLAYSFGRWKSRLSATTGRGSIPSV
jgi:hypothetical protein